MNILELREKYGAPLTPEQQAHIEGIIERFADFAYRKYVKGQQEHGGDLWKKNIMPDAILEEAVDQVVYADTLKRQIETVGVNLGDPALSD